MRLPAAGDDTVVGIIGFIDVPIVHFSVDWWRTLHPGPVIDEKARPNARTRMESRFQRVGIADSA